MRIVIIEPSYTGHHLPYITHVIDAYLSSDINIILITSVLASKSEEYRKLIKPIENKLRIIRINLVGFNSRNKYVRTLVNTLFAVKSIFQYRANKYFFPTLDPVFFLLGLFSLIFKWNKSKKRNIEGIIFQEGEYVYNYKKLHRGEKFRLWLTKKIIEKGPYYRILFLNEQVGDYLNNNSKCSTLLVNCPDPTEEAPNIDFLKARELLNIPSEFNILGVVGIVDERKGVDRLIEAFKLYNIKKNEYLLLFGKQSPLIRNALKKMKYDYPNVFKKILISDEFLDKEKMLMVINAVNTIVAIYPKQIGSASIVIRACAAGKPVLGSNFGWIGYVIEKYSLGLAVDAFDEKQIILGIDWGFSHPQIDTVKSFQLYQNNRIDKFKNTLLNKTEL